MSYSGSSQEILSECHAGRDAASFGGCERPLEGQKTACQEGGCSPASSCLQVCRTPNSRTLRNSGQAKPIQYVLFFAVFVAGLQCTCQSHFLTMLLARCLLPICLISMKAFFIMTASCGGQLSGTCNNMKCDTARAIPHEIAAVKVGCRVFPGCSNLRCCCP